MSEKEINLIKCIILYKTHNNNYNIEQVTRYIFDQSVWECNGHFDHWFSNIKSFLCDIWNLRKEKLYPEDFSMNIASNSSVERRVVNGRNAMAKRP